MFRRWRERQNAKNLAKVDIDFGNVTQTMEDKTEEIDSIQTGKMRDFRNHDRISSVPTFKSRHVSRVTPENAFPDALKKLN